MASVLGTGRTLEKVIIIFNGTVAGTTAFIFMSSTFAHTISCGEVLGGKFVGPMEVLFEVAFVNRGECWPVNTVEYVVVPSKAVEVVLLEGCCVGQFLDGRFEVSCDGFVLVMQLDLGSGI